ncbi:MAG: hypothetical protein IKN04_10410 [Clostridia bacterium]|nr:hypothetical protein [Clostridia bacterium]
MEKGDIVRLRDAKDLAREYGTYANGSIKTKVAILPGMKELCGAQYTINTVNRDRDGNIEYITFDEIPYGWPEEAIEKEEQDLPEFDDSFTMCCIS